MAHPMGVQVYAWAKIHGGKAVVFRVTCFLFCVAYKFKGTAGILQFGTNAVKEAARTKL